MKTNTLKKNLNNNRTTNTSSNIIPNGTQSLTHPLIEKKPLKAKSPSQNQKTLSLADLNQADKQKVVKIIEKLVTLGLSCYYVSNLYYYYYYYCYY